MAGPSTQLAPACSTCAASTMPSTGHPCQHHGAHGDDDHRRHREAPRRSCSIHNGAARDLADQRDEAADGEQEADIDLRPFLLGQVDRDEGTEPGLHVGDGEHEPVEPAQAGARGSGWAVDGRWQHWLLHASTGLARLLPIMRKVNRDMSRAEDHLSLAASLGGAVATGCESSGPSTTTGVPSLYSARAARCCGSDPR